MRNWSVDETILKKHPTEYARWRLEQQINFGLDGKKISQRELLKHWSHLRLDPHRRKFLALLLNGRLPRH